MSDVAFIHIQLEEWKNLPFENDLETALKKSTPEITYFQVNHDDSEGMIHYCKALIKESSLVYIFLDSRQ